MKKAYDDIINYYQQELHYLKDAGREFAQAHPKIARRLDLNHNGSNDPHTERLLQSFAFLTANLRKDIDDKFPQFSHALLNVLYPQLVSPVPPMTVAQFIVDPSKDISSNGHYVPANTQVFSRSLEGEVCRFSTCYDVSLWPITITEAELCSSDAYTNSNPSLSTYLNSNVFLRLRIKSLRKSLRQINCHNLRIHLDGARYISLYLYLLLASQGQIKIALVPASSEAKEAQFMQAARGDFMGFATDHSCLPYPPQVDHSYRLLHEYFCCLEKFLFFELNNLDFSACDDTSADLLLSINPQLINPTILFSAQNFKLGCTPIINLFSKITEPLRLNHRNYRYRLVANRRREATTEIHSIHQVMTAFDSELEVVPPFFAWDYQAERRHPTVFWYSERAQAKAAKGTDLYLSFVDLQFNPQLPARKIVYATTLCTNRNLATHIPAGGKLQTEIATPTLSIVCLNRPSASLLPPLSGEIQWRLISHLTASYLGFASTNPIAEGKDNAACLRELLGLYADITHPEHLDTIDSLDRVLARPTVRRIGIEAWRGFVTGYALDLWFKPTTQNGESLLLGKVLHHFLASQVAIDSFVESTIHNVQYDFPLAKMAAQTGHKPLL